MKKILIGLIILVVLISGCLRDEDIIRQATEDYGGEIVEKAPGCEGAGISPTGCLGKSLIKDIKVEPTVECLKVEANNCNGGILEIDNKCADDLEVGSKTVRAGSFRLIEFVRDGAGDIRVIEPEGNPDSYNPEKEDTLSAKGKLGETEVIISYTKENVCGESKMPNIPYLKMEKDVFIKDEMIKASVETKKILFTNFYSFNVYKLIDGEWQYIDVYDAGCNLPCTSDESDICSEIQIACAPIPEHCQDFDSLLDKFEWDQTIYKSKEVECPEIEGTRYCSFTERAGLGIYKIVFKYSEGCANEGLFEAEENNVQSIEKQLEIK